MLQFLYNCYLYHYIVCQQLQIYYISHRICSSNGQEMANPSIIIPWIQLLTHRILPRDFLIELPTLPSHVFQKHLSTCLSGTLIKRNQNQGGSCPIRFQERKYTFKCIFPCFYIYLNDVQSTYNLLVISQFLYFQFC